MSFDASRASGKRPLVVTAAYYAGFIALGLVNAALGPTVQRLAERTGSVLSEISIVFTFRSLGYLLGSFLSGRAYDRVRGHPVMMGALIVMGISMLLAPGVSWLWLLAFVFFFAGAAEGTLDVGGNTLLVWVHGPRVGPWMNALHFFFGVGAFLSPILIAEISRYTGDVTWAYRAIALLNLPPAIWLLLLPSPTANHTPEQAAARPASPWLIVNLAALFFLFVGAEISFGGWVHTYSTTLGLADETMASYLTSAFWGALTVGRLLAIPIAARARAETILIVDLAICVGSVALILLVPGSSVVLWIGAMALGLGMASVFPTMIVLAESRMTVTGAVTGWFLVGSSAGGMSVPWLIGQLFESTGPRVTMLAILVDLVVAVFLWWALTRQKDPTQSVDVTA